VVGRIVDGELVRLSFELKLPVLDAIGDATDGGAEVRGALEIAVEVFVAR
jgi:hypothetical protein